MSKQFVQNKYNAGDVVYAKESPALGLIIRRYIDQVYYCKIQGDPERKELVYFERELVPDARLALKNETARKQSNRFIQENFKSEQNKI